ncbi:MAG: TonB-dependent receptor [Acidobacteria bacterium]|nr:MAG: TonB-dependent receptor [Acidobacteriota bacterium]
MRLRQSFILGMFFFILNISTIEGQQGNGTLDVQVRNNSRPVEQAQVTVGDHTILTDASGEAAFDVPAGAVEVRVERYGFKPQTTEAVVPESGTTRVMVDLEAEAVLKQEITVTATRTETRIEDEPLRVEVLNQEEVEEKALMTPGDIAMLLNETSGLRVQVTSPSLGAANVRVQGLRGRYAQLLSDGLPLYGGQTGSIGLLQIPPLDIGQVEIIKGVASALYGPSALGGVINLVSRRPSKSERQMLLNTTSRGGKDAAFWFAEPPQNGFGYTMLGGAHFQEQKDIDRDGWANIPSYRRLDLRPRLFWDNGNGRSVFATFGAMTEDRKGGTIGNATVPDGHHFPEELSTERFDGGVVGRFLAGNHPVSVRGSVMTQSHRHQFGGVLERDRSTTWFGETAISGTAKSHTWVAGSALQADVYRSREVPALNYTYVVPALFAQDEYLVASGVTVSASGRVDLHNKYGAFLNPRLSALLRLPHKFTARLSSGTGVFAPTPFTEQTEAVGLSKLMPLKNIRRERAWSASGDLGWTSSHLELNGTVFGSVIHDPIMLSRSSSAPDALEIVNVREPTRTMGSEFLARFHRGDFGLVLTHTFVHSTEIDREKLDRQLVPLTPKHTAGIVGTWEREEWGRIGIEAFYTGVQRLDDNPYRASSLPYWLFGVLVERRLGRVRLFVNAENLANVRQTKHNPLLRPARSFDGQWTVDEWAPLDGRVINGGLRFGF